MSLPLIGIYSQGVDVDPNVVRIIDETDYIFSFENRLGGTTYRAKDSAIEETFYSMGGEWFWVAPNDFDKVRAVTSLWDNTSFQNNPSSEINSR